MKILIIGGTAVIGKALASCFAHLGEVRLAGRREADISLDLTEWNAQPEPGELFDVVVHVAADFGGITDKDYIRAELVNAVGAFSACSLAHRAQAKHFVLLSTISATYRSGDPYYGVYALSKRHGEEAASFFCAERGIPLTILRPTQVYDDSGECRHHQALLYLMADRAQDGQEIVLYGTHDARRNYLYLADLAEICGRVVQGRYAGTFACAYPKSVLLSEMANAAFSAYGNVGKVNFRADKPNLADLPTIEDYSLYERIDYWPSVDISEGFKRIRRYRERNS